MNISFVKKAIVNQSGLYLDSNNKEHYHLDVGHKVKVIGSVKYPGSRKKDILAKVKVEGAERKMWISEELLTEY